MSSEEENPAAVELSFFRQRAEERIEPAPGLAPGKVVGDFRLVALIGQGGMGQVWEAEQVSLGKRHVAVKFVRPERVTEKQLEFFAREARAGGRLTHPGIVGVHGHGTSDGLAWIAMEFIGGAWTLRDFLDDVVRVPETPRGYDQHVARFTAEIADAMQVAHEAGVIHRDLKPQNILITTEDHPKVTDFGLARITDESALSQTGDFAGTYFYMSPEQVTAKRMGIDHRTDIFSLGVVLYELLALRRPFEGDTTHQIAEQIVTEDPPDPRTIRSRVPRDLAVIAGRALEKSRDKRFQTMKEFAADLRRYLADEPIRARPPTSLDRGLKWVRRNPAKSSVAGVVGAALVVISLLLVANIRAKHQIEVKSVESEARRMEAERAAAAERLRANEVLRLSDLQSLEDLVHAADELWPTRPNNTPALRHWLEEAQALVGKQAQHAKSLAELRAHALPWTEEERLAERQGHPEWPRRQALQGTLECRRRALFERRDGTREGAPTLDWSQQPTGSVPLNNVAWPLVDPKRKTFGQEPFALALAERALEQAPVDERHVFGDTLAWALFALGRDDEALGASVAALAAAPAEKQAEFEGYLEDLEAAVEAATSPSGLSRAQEELSALEQQASALDAVLDERRRWRYADERENWWDAQLKKLIRELEALQAGLLAPDSVTAAHGWSIPKRLTLAEQQKQGFAPGGEYARAWEDALPAIRRTVPGLALVPQLGLVPLGPDPASGLWEFAHLASGEVARRAADGRLVIGEESGLVFVLLPGGSFAMGAQKADPSAANYDPDLAPDETPAHEVQLTPFFLSKYEMTQSQWLRFTGEKPSHVGPKNWSPGWNRGEAAPLLTHPVEKVSWSECMRQCRRYGLELPSEAQWEYAVRGASGEPWWFGSDPAALATAGNLADLQAKRTAQAGVLCAEWDDGAAVHLPVSAQDPNPFGFHGMLGNVWEWCEDGYFGDAYRSLAGLDPVAPASPAGARVRRGGAYSSPLTDSRSANRGNDSQDAAVWDCGLRPARAIERP